MDYVEIVLCKNNKDAEEIYYIFSHKNTQAQKVIDFQKEYIENPKKRFYLSHKTKKPLTRSQHPQKIKQKAKRKIKNRILNKIQKQSRKKNR
ncbi:MAG: hypothetical protein RLZZ628_375 [Bacteroidota bacterium]|jgi:hypothetical protein